MATVRARHSLGFGSDLKKVPAEDRTVYFSWDGETGNLSDWTGLGQSVVPTISTVQAHGGTYSMECAYFIAGGTGLHLDSNVYAYKTIAQQPESIYARGYVYHALPTGSGTYHPVNRKLIWLGADTAAVNWTCGLTTDSSAGTPSPATVRFFVNGSAGCGNGSSNASPQYAAGTMFWQNWVCVEVFIQLNTPGASDGIAGVWINGTQVTYDTAMNIRGSCSTGVGYVSFGRQADRTNNNEVDEKRYWDDIVVASTYTGL